MDPTPHVVILGGGFGGLSAARALRKAPVRITLLDRRNHHLFQPLLYQVATAALNAGDIAAPIRHILSRQKNATVLMAEATAIDAAGRKIVLADGECAYDRLIVATGATHSYFGHPEWAPYAVGLKTIEDALEIRRRVLSAYEQAEREQDPETRKAWLTFVIVGGGPTGVELAGALAEIARHALVRDFRNIDPRQSRILLLQGGDRVLPTFPPDLCEKARLQLVGLGVEVRLNALVTGIDAESVRIGEERIPAKTALWAAGVAASPLAKSLGVKLDNAGRVEINPDLSIPGHPEIQVIGDLAALKQDGKLLPGVAPAAMQQGRHAALNIARAVRGEPALPFVYKDKGSLAVIGRGAGVAAFPKSNWSGFVAWWAWLIIHILFLIGFRNRMLVLFQWAWAYWTWQRGARLITGGNGTRPKS
ncbi:MAG TPA: NAD(P)/FAD-dependent oxidoreductase [Planctomycetota bacterium]|nr:NAD(P)/FAD-dependent oxidoreductase [Planctomycetota bacterium]